MVSNLKEHNARVNDVKCLFGEPGILEGFLGGGFKCFIFSPLFGEDSPF